MATKGTWNQANIRKTNPVFSPFRVTIETPFYANNIYPVSNVKEAYEMAKDSPGTIVTSLKVKDPERIGLDNNAHVLLFNDGAVYGRCAAARRIYGQPGIEVAEFSSILREAVYKTRYRQLYQAEAVIGLDPDFMVRARLCVPEEHENILYNWMLNFQPINEKYYQMYQQSHVLEKEGDILVFSDPDWSDPRFPLGLSFFDPKTNCAAILGMRYFGEFKKGTLTLAWNIANKNGYVSCHGGLKKYDLKEKGAYVIAFFGLSGSGKSTLTHAKHGGKYDISILHDDAFVISKSNGSSIALEPTYFDKTADYPSDFPDNAFLLTVQNNGATLNEKDEIVLVPEDMRNGNGRAIKSRYWAPNRVDKMSEPIQTIVWLMQDPTIPPLLKINDPVTASAFGATLATKRTSAERLAEGVDPNALVIEPYANPFRTFPLKEDFDNFKALFADRGVDCYIFNTGFFGSKKIPKEVTLALLEGIVEKSLTFKKFGPYEQIQIAEVDGFIPQFGDDVYRTEFKKRLEDRLRFVESKKTAAGGYDALPEEASDILKHMIQAL